MITRPNDAPVRSQPDNQCRARSIPAKGRLWIRLGSFCIAVCLTAAVLSGCAQTQPTYDTETEGTQPLNLTADIPTQEAASGQTEPTTEATEPATVPETQPETEPAPAAPTYLMADTATRYITYQDLEGYSKEELRLIRNEIFARHGRRFHDSQLQAYFDAQSWYTGTTSPEAFHTDTLNEYERENVFTIKAYEDALS